MGKTKGYLPVSSSEESNSSHNAHEKCNTVLRKVIQTLVVLFGILGALSVGYALGSKHAIVPSANTIGTFMTTHHVSTNSHKAVPVGNMHYYMQFNKTFPQRPNEESDAAWASLFPEKLGFIQHPELAPEVAGIAVFHELHCLVGRIFLHSPPIADNSEEHATRGFLGIGRREFGGDGR